MGLVVWCETGGVRWARRQGRGERGGGADWNGMEFVSFRWERERKLMGKDGAQGGSKRHGHQEGWWQQAWM